MRRLIKFIFIFLFTLLSASGDTENDIHDKEPAPISRNIASEILESEKEMSKSETLKNEMEIEKSFQIEQSLVDENKINKHE